VQAKTFDKACWKQACSPFSVFSKLILASCGWEGENDADLWTLHMVKSQTFWWCHSLRLTLDILKLQCWCPWFAAQIQIFSLMWNSWMLNVCFCFAYNPGLSLEPGEVSVRLQTICVQDTYRALFPYQNYLTLTSLSPCDLASIMYLHLPHAYFLVYILPELYIVVVASKYQNFGWL
jgi:hypothetical protein